jgi:hypothetical protein
LLALIVFGVTLRYHEAVEWFAASFAILALDTMLLALLAAQRWRQTGRVAYLALCLAGVLAAPLWFASGVLAGPVCALYLLPQDTKGGAAWRGRLAAGLPVLATALYLAAALPLIARSIGQAEHFGGRPATEVFSLRTGAVNTARTLVDALLINQTGVAAFALPLWLVPLPLALLAFLAWRWCRPAPRRLVWPGLGLVLLTYLLTFSARAEWPYDKLLVFFSRYHVLPMLGVALLAAGGLAGRPHLLDPPEGLTRGQVCSLGGLLLVLVLVQFPAGLIAPVRWAGDVPEQQAALRRIEEVDARCREHRIAAEAAREALPPFVLPQSGDFNGWRWLRGSDDPVPRPPEEVRRVLLERE